MTNADALPCIVCGKELTNVFAESNNQPEDGIAFTTHGHYGSTVFDPQDNSYLEINICDDCLLIAATQKRVYRGVKVIFPQGNLQLWDRKD
jgi:hypothetical protein